MPLLKKTMINLPQSYMLWLQILQQEIENIFYLSICLGIMFYVNFHNYEIFIKQLTFLHFVSLSFLLLKVSLK